ncbi:hypothetical protein ACHQM5_028778 [Ranunculus cassubicifolius]
MEISSSSSSSTPNPYYTLKPIRIFNEDILFCIDADLQSQIEMKIPPIPNGRPITRLESIKQAIRGFIHAKLSINPDHRFGFAALGKSASMLRKEFSNEIGFANSVLQSFTASVSFPQADLSQLFRIAVNEANRCNTQNRLLRVILIYCRSSTPPTYEYPLNEKLFTFDVVYLHDKPNPDNCPQKVYDALVDALEHVTKFEGYIFESGQGLSRVLCRQMYSLLAHPQQRCVQDAIDFPKTLAVKVIPVDSGASEENVMVIS